MTNDQSAYFAARSIEERALAENSITRAGRRAHLQLAERYKAAADGEIMSAYTSKTHQRTGRGRRTIGRSAITLDMGEESRLQGFRAWGCR
jgi:hypothetical protein